MTGTPEPQGKFSSFSELYPHLTEQERTDAEDRFDRYIALAVRIFERLRNDPTFPENIRALTDEPSDFTISEERSSEKEINKKE